MRILRFFGVFSLLLIGLSLGGFLFLREVLLVKATSDIKTAVRKMELATSSQSQYTDACIRRGGSSSRPIAAVELRFVDDTNYEVDAICEYFSDEPIVIATYVLPYFVKKVPGEAGLIWDSTGRSGIHLEMWGAKKTILLDGNEVAVLRGAQTIDGNRPAATCEGFGYSCCDPVTQVGSGELMTTANNCPATCFPVCESRPVVLRLFTDPPPDIRNKVVGIAPDSPVTIFFNVDVGQSKQAEVTVNFGDGQQQVLNQTEGSVSHVYSCGSDVCEYLVTIQAMDEAARKSAVTSISSMTVRVQR